MMMAGWGDTERLDMIEPGVGRLVDKLRRSSFLRLPPTIACLPNTLYYCACAETRLHKNTTRVDGEDGKELAGDAKFPA